MILYFEAMRIGLAEILLVESIIFTLLWIWDDYVAIILTVSITGILFAILLISLAAEKIERSNVPRKYFGWMFWALFPPIIIAFIYSYFIEGQFTWMNEI